MLIAGSIKTNKIRMLARKNISPDSQVEVTS
jgi:hypothetical protein